MFEDLPNQRAELWRARQIGAVAGDIDAGEHNLVVAVGDQAAHVLDRRPDRHRARIAAAKRDDAKGATVVAAVLHLHEGTRPAGECFDQMRRGVLHRHDVVDDRFRRTRNIERGARFRPARRRQLLAIAEHAVGLGHGGERLRLGLRGAAGHDDFCPRAAAPERPYFLPRLTYGFRSDCAGIDHDSVGEAGALRLAANDFGFGGIEPAAEGDDLDARYALYAHG